MHSDDRAIEDPVLLAQVLVEASNDAVFTKDLQGRYRWANPATLAAIGKSADEVIGRTAADILSDPAAARALMENDRRVLAGGEVLEVEESVPSRDGGWRHWLTRKIPLRDGDGRPIGLLAVAREITERKLAQAQRELIRLKLEMGVQAAGLVMAEIDYRTGQNHISAELAQLFELGDAPMTVPRQVIFDRIHPDDRARYLAGIAGAIDPAGNGHLAIRVRALLPSGAVKWLDIRLQVTFAVVDGRLVPERGMCAARDVTPEVLADAALRASEARFRAAAEAASDILWTNDPSGRMVGAQPGWAAFTGQSQDEYQGHGWTRAVHPDDAQPTLDAWNAAVASNSKFVFEHRVRRHDGVYRTFSIRALPVTDAQGQVREWMGVHTDVTAMRAAQQTIERQNHELREADARKDRFLATLSHELRNPLAPIRTAAELLGRPRLGAEQLAMARQVIQRQVRHMALLLDDLLDVARITQGKLELRRERVPLAAIVDSAVEAVRPLVERKQHRLRVELPARMPVLDADPLRLAQVLSNLLTNAAKYTDAGGCITLRAEVQGAALRLEVQDTGIGLAPEAVPRLFEMFSQVRGTADRSEGGLGVGLALCKALVGLHGGSVAVASAGPGHGCSFSVCLPMPAALSHELPGKQV